MLDAGAFAKLAEGDRRVLPSTPCKLPFLVQVGWAACLPFISRAPGMR